MGERIKKLRGKRTGKAIAEMAAITPAFFSEIERGVKTPSIETLVNLAAALGTTVGYLMQETEESCPTLKNETFLDDDNNTKKSQATSDLEEMIRDLAHDNPDIVVLLRDTRKHWNDYSDLDKQFISDSITLALGRANADIEKRLKKESKDGPL